jgi:uncharacterized caspase-like protein
MTLTKICRDMEVSAVPHGFRSSFRDWVAEETDFDGEIAEMALARSDHRYPARPAALRQSALRYPNFARRSINRSFRA